MTTPGTALGLSFAIAASATAQEAGAPRAEPAQKPPVFEAVVDLVAVDVAVVDAEGRPLTGLGPADFEIEVDGRPRAVVSTEYLGRDLEPPRTPERPAHYSSNEDAAPGRLVLLLIDRGNIGRGGGRQALASAERFLGTLAPSDRVGLATVPGPGPNIEFSDDRAAVRQALKHVVGQADRFGFQVPLSEAIAYLKLNDRLRWDQFVSLECGRFGIANQYEQCAQQMEAEARQVFLNYRERTLQSVRAIESVFVSLRGVPGPKTVVLVSEGLATESPAETRKLAEAAAEAQVTLFVLLLDTSGVDPEFRRAQLATTEERELEARSLYDLAGLARGAVLPVVGSADGPFQRIARELMGYYMVGFEPEPADRSGRTHAIRVRVKRDGATVRSRGLLSIPTTPASPRQSITTALRSPLVERGLPLRVASYARPAPGGKVRLLIAAEVARASRPVSVGFVLIAAGKVVASRIVEGLSAGEGEAVVFAGEAAVDPGAYTLRLAAVDAGGRRGSVHHDTKAAVVTAGGLLVSDLLLAAPGPGALRPVVDLEAGPAGLLALVELAGRGDGALAGAGMALELAESEDGAALLRVPGELSQPDRDGVRVARVALGGGLLPPGPYVARAAVSAGGKPVAAVSRPFHVALPAAGAAAAARAPLAALLSQPRPFDKDELLSPAILSHFVDRMAALVPGPPLPAVAAAAEEARAGRPLAIEAQLSSAGEQDARVAFLRGVSLYAAGRLNQSLAELRAALRTRSDFFPAAAYMGACYAAAGKDLDAIGAWQTALIGESGSPALYAVLADALLRVREPDQAVAILDEGLAAFPRDPGLLRRQALARAMTGEQAKALEQLSAWLESHPDDTGALFATLALLFEGFSRAAAGAVEAEERQRLRRYSRAYIDAKGPNREVVERWLRYIDSREGG